MGSVCCTSARAGDMTDASEGWSVEHSSGHNQESRHGALSPPPLSSRWERKSQFLEFAPGPHCMSLHRTSSSSSRIYRSNSNHSESGIMNSSHCRPERGDGLLAIVNSPSESFQYSQHSFDHGSYSVAMPLESVGLRRSAAYLTREESGRSTASVSSGSAGVSEDPELVLKLSKPVLSFTKHGLSASKTCLQSRQVVDSSQSFEGSSRYEMIKTSMDMPSAYFKQKLGSQRVRGGFSELVDSSQPGSSRWSSMGGVSANILVDGNHEDLNELYIRSTGPMQHHDFPCSAAQIETQICGLCAKAISEKSLWNLSRVLGIKDMPVVGILDCGHVYHAECLDQATPLMQVHDPPCPKCTDHEKTQHNVQGESHEKSKGIGLIERSSVKWKLSRVGISTDDFADLEPSKGYQLNHCGLLSESFSKRGAVLSSLGYGTERSLSTKSLLKKQFSLRGKLGREASGTGTSSSIGSKRPGFPARVSPESSIREDELAGNWRKVL